MVTTESAMTLPPVLDAIEAALRMEEDSWNPLVLHVSDLGYTLPDALCPRQLWLRLRDAPKRELHRGELLMFRNAKEMHLDMTMLLGAGLAKVAPGWKIAYVEHSYRAEAGVDLGLEPDEDVIDKGQLDVELHGPNGEVVIVDWKTVRGNAFRYIDATGPKSTNVLQVRTYARKRDAIAALLAYVDREGQNFGREFMVTRDDAAVVEAAHKARAIADADIAPPLMRAKLERKNNKGPDSLSIVAPWQCERCPFHRISCPGALEEGVECGTVIANITDKGELKLKTDNKATIAALDMLLPDLSA